MAKVSKLDCARLEAKQEYYLAQIKNLIGNDVSVPPYLAGYASAAADSLETLGCPLKDKLNALI